MERRKFLVLGAAAVGLAGCTSGSSEPTPPSQPPSPTAPEDPDGRLRDAVAASEVALIAAYRAAIEAESGLAVDLEPFLAHHEQHLARVAPDFEAESGSPSASASASPSESEAPTGPEDSTPNENTPSAGSALAALAEVESAAQAQRASACNGAQDPGLARDLCLIAASEAQHADALAGLAAQESQ